MEHPFKVGDYVICVDAAGETSDRIEEGKSYRVLWAHTWDKDDHRIKVTDHHGSGWYVKRFVLDKFRTEVANAE